jgi:hypothetical protein
VATQTEDKLNWLEHHLPEGLVVDAAWMSAHGYSTALRSQYGAAGWLKQPARRVYQRPRGTLAWQPVVISLQTLLRYDLLVGGLTALELQGFAHYVRRNTSFIHLSGPRKPPTWLDKLLPDARFIYRNDTTLFQTLHASTAPHELEPRHTRDGAIQVGMVIQPWGQWTWPLCLSSPERAILEVLNELPEHESFHQVDMLMEGLSTLSPNRLNPLLADCRSVKVKRLFFFFAGRHNHAWLKRLDRKSIDLGKGKRMLVKGGRLDPKYLITVPGDLDGLQ